MKAGKWTSSNVYVNIDTGEIIKNNVARNDEKWNKIKILNKKINYNEERNGGHIEYTIGVRKNPQQRIFV